MVALSFKTAFLGDAGPVDATRLDASALLDASSSINALSLLAFDGDNNDAPVRTQATAVGGGGTGGFTTQIDFAGIQIDIGGALDGVHKRLAVAAPLQLRSDAPPGTRVAVTPASTGTSTVTVQGGAVYRLPPTDNPDTNPGRTATFTLIDYTEFECIALGQWDVWGVPAGAETTLAGPLDLDSQTIIPGPPVAISLTVGRDPYLASDSGKTFEVTGTGTPAPHVIPAGLLGGWSVDIYNGTASGITIDGPGANVTLAAGGVATVKVLNGGRARVSTGATTLIS